MVNHHPNRYKTKTDLSSSRSRVLPVPGEGPGGWSGQGGLHCALAFLVCLIQLSIGKGPDASPPELLQLLQSHHTCFDDIELKHLPNADVLTQCSAVYSSAPAKVRMHVQQSQRNRSSHSAIAAVKPHSRQIHNSHSQFTAVTAHSQQPQSIQSNGGATWIRVLRRVSVTTPSDSTSNSC